MKTIRPKCQKVHRIAFRHGVKCMAQTGSDVAPDVIDHGTIIHARVEAAVNPQHRVETANLYECNWSGEPTGTVYFGVPYAKFTFSEDEPGSEGTG